MTAKRDPACEAFLEDAAACSPERLARATAHRMACEDCRGAQVVLEALQRTAVEPSPRSLAGLSVRVRASLSQAEARSRRTAPLRAALLSGALAAGGAAGVGLALDALFPRVQAPEVKAAVALQAPGSALPEGVAETEGADGALLEEDAEDWLSDEPLAAVLERAEEPGEPASLASNEELVEDPLDDLTSDELSRLWELLGSRENMGRGG